MLILKNAFTVNTNMSIRGNITRFQNLRLHFIIIRSNRFFPLFQFKMIVTPYWNAVNYIWQISTPNSHRYHHLKQISTSRGFVSSVVRPLADGSKSPGSILQHVQILVSRVFTYGAFGWLVVSWSWARQPEFGSISIKLVLGPTTWVRFHLD